MKGFVNIVKKDHHWQNHAFVENGNIIASNGHCLAVVPMDSVVDDLEGFSEGKGFNFELLKELNKRIYTSFRFTENTVQAFKKNSETPDFESLYSSVLVDKDSRRFAIIKKDGSVSEENTYIVPRWPEVIPPTFGGEIKTTVLDPEILKGLASVFNTDCVGVALEFTGENNKPIKVTPIHKGQPDENKGYGIMMPLLLKSQ